MQKTGRNDLCHCGSGKKYKNCHQELDNHKKANNKSLIIGVLIAIFIIIMAIGIYFNAQSSGNTPPGNAPEGKVWSSEHGHWHDAE